MIKRIVIFLIISIFVVCAGAVSIYFINPFAVETDNIRPRLFGFDVYRIPSKSMQPLLFPGDYISVSSTAYLNANPQQKDVVIFYRSNKNKSKIKTAFIKRVLATAGDTILLKNGKLIVNNMLVEESYVLLENNQSSNSQNMKLITVPENNVFVLGDNRDNSSDSRMFGSVAVDEIFAKASGILYGINNRSGTTVK